MKNNNNKIKKKELMMQGVAPMMLFKNKIH